MVTVVSGIIIGLAQYIALRHALSRAILWILIAAGAWFLGLQLGFALSGQTEDYNLLVAALLNGAITGLALRLLITEKSAAPIYLIPPTLIARWSTLSLVTRLLLISLIGLVSIAFLVFAGRVFGIY